MGGDTPRSSSLEGEANPLRGALFAHQGESGNLATLPQTRIGSKTKARVKTEPKHSSEDPVYFLGRVESPQRRRVTLRKPRQRKPRTASNSNKLSLLGGSLLALAKRTSSLRATLKSAQLDQSTRGLTSQRRWSRGLQIRILTSAWVRRSVLQCA